MSFSDEGCASLCSMPINFVLNQPPDRRVTTNVYLTTFNEMHMVCACSK